MLACGHEAAAFGSPVCTHLRSSREGYVGYLICYTGRGLSTEFLCPACVEARERGEIAVAEPICEQCFLFACDEVGDPIGVRGRPEIKRRDERISAAVTSVSLPDAIGPVPRIAPIDGIAGAQWLVLTEDGALSRFDAATGDTREIARLGIKAGRGSKLWSGNVLGHRLHVSHFGTFAAVVLDFGRWGQIVDLRTGAQTAILDGGDYLSEQVPFAFAFAEVNGRTVAVHRASWNRLDLIDPATGDVLSQRASPTRDGDNSAHYLNYFHGTLRISPDSKFIVDDGWIWHPSGCPTSWSLERWVNENVWESESGPTRQSLCWRDYYWNGPMCWIDDTHVAIGGIGDDSERMIEGALLFDVSDFRSRRSKEYMTIAGPAGTFFSDGFSLFSADKTGLSRWSLSDGARTGHIAGFQPTQHHRGAGELVELRERELVRWRIC